MPNFKAGQFVRFTYNRPPEALDQASGDRHKEVFVLNPQWLGEMHGIDLKRLTVAEREVLVEIFDPKMTAGKSKLPLVNDILRRMDPRREITNPMAFYQKFVKQFLRNKDAYRRYQPARMQNITVSRKSTVLGNVVNPKPLFHKTETQAQQQQSTPFQKKPGSEHSQGRKLTPAEIQAIAQKMGVKVSPGTQKPKATTGTTGTTGTQSGASRMSALKAAAAKAALKKGNK